MFCAVLCCAVLCCAALCCANLQVTKLARSEWSVLRTVMGSKIGRPRRFSPAFVDSERANLKEYRNTVRAIQADPANVPEDFPHEVRILDLGSWILLLEKSGMELFY
jgi:hypothetical protein